MSAVFSVYSNKRSPSNVFLLISAPILISAIRKIYWNKQHLGMR